MRELSDAEKRIVRAWSTLVRADVLPAIEALARWSDLEVSQVAYLLPGLRAIGQLP